MAYAIHPRLRTKTITGNNHCTPQESPLIHLDISINHTGIATWKRTMRHKFVSRESPYKEIRHPSCVHGVTHFIPLHEGDLPIVIKYTYTTSHYVPATCIVPKTPKSRCYPISDRSYANSKYDGQRRSLVAAVSKQSRFLPVALQLRNDCNVHRINSWSRVLLPAALR